MCSKKCENMGALERENEDLRLEVKILERQRVLLENEVETMKSLLKELTEQIKKKMVGMGQWPL